MFSEMGIDPLKTALVLMDVQPRQVSRVSDPGYLQRLVSLRDTFDRNHAQVVHVRVAFTPQDRRSISSRNKSFGALATGSANAEGTADAEIVEELAPRDMDIVVRKTRFGAFSTTNLDQLLRGRDIDTLVLAGLTTSGVVLSTVREAGDRDYRLFVVADGCDDPDADLHSVLLEKVISRQADLVDTATIVGR
jgi:nicotinamidase-related amidase